MSLLPSCLPELLAELHLLSSLLPSFPPSASGLPALSFPGAFSGLVYKNVTVPVYTALKGVSDRLPGIEGLSPPGGAPSPRAVLALAGEG